MSTIGLFSPCDAVWCSHGRLACSVRQRLVVNHPSLSRSLYVCCMLIILSISADLCGIAGVFSTQIFFGLCLSAASLSAQIRLSPYKHGKRARDSTVWLQLQRNHSDLWVLSAEDNLLKTGTEIAIYLTLLVALMLKTLSADISSKDESLQKEFYDWMLVCIFAIGLPIAFLATVVHKKGQMRAALAPATETSPSAARQRAIKLFQLGIASSIEVRLLADYIEKLEQIVKKDTHVFISYRVAANAGLARQLFEELSVQTLEATGQRIRVYLDAERLEDGQRWDSGFMGGLAQSTVFIPIVSAGALKPMLNLGAAGDGAAELPDYMLVEWAAALELERRGTLKAVLPLIVSASDDFRAETTAAFGGLQALPDTVPEATLEKVQFHLEETTGG